MLKKCLLGFWSLTLVGLGEARGQGMFPTGEVLHAPYDQACDVMATSVAPASSWLMPGKAAYFAQPIERNIHQIWFGGLWRMNEHKVARWQAHAARFGYAHRLWSEADLPALEGVVPAENLAIVWSLLQRGEYYGASDVLRISLLEHFGGIYADIDIGPPVLDGDMIDMADVVPMSNIVFMSEHQGRNVGRDVALFVANSLMMSSAHHPMMQHLVAGLPANVQAVSQASLFYSNIHVAYYTGPFYINRSLSGPVTLLPITFLEDLGMSAD